MISVALCTYNGSRYLAEQLESLTNQTLLPTEVHVGDDGSTDDTVAILERFRRVAPFPVHVTRNARSLGYGENFMQTAGRCSSRFIAFCDQDDVWAPDKLERCAEVLKDGVVLVVHDSMRVDADDRDLGALYGWEDAVHPSLSLLPRWFCVGLCQVFDRTLLELPRQPLPWAEVPDAHDVWIPFVAGLSGTIVQLSARLARYRQHGTNLSSTLRNQAPANAREAALANIGYVEEAGRIAGELGFERAAVHYASFAGRLSKRLQVQAGPNKLRAFTALLSSGAYRSGGYERFGKRALIADLRALFTG